MDSLLNLVRVSFSYNKLKELLPSTFGQLNNLSLLHLHGNELERTVDFEIGDFITDCGETASSPALVECIECNYCCNDKKLIAFGRKMAQRFHCRCHKKIQHDNNISYLRISKTTFHPSFEFGRGHWHRNNSCQTISNAPRRLCDLGCFFLIGNKGVLPTVNRLC